MASRSETKQPTASTWTAPDLAASPLPDATPFHVTRPVNLGQLIQELSESLGVVVGGAMVSSADSTPERTDAVLWLVPASLDADSVAKVIAAHEQDAHWGVPEFLQRAHAACDKLLADPETPLSAEEQHHLLVGLAHRVMGRRS
jgi:hypothetical protein